MNKNAQQPSSRHLNLNTQGSRDRTRHRHQWLLAAVLLSLLLLLWSYTTGSDDKSSNVTPPISPTETTRASERTAIKPAPIAMQPAQDTTRAKTIPLHYLKAATLAALINTHHKLLSKTGILVPDTARNQIWVLDHPRQLNHLTQLIAAIDQPTRQIRIQTTLVSIDHHYIRTLGLPLQTHTRPLGTSIQSTQLPTVQWPLTPLRATQGLSLQLNALTQAGHAEVLSNPALLTSNQVPASIESGEDLPYQEQTKNGGTSTRFKRAALKLKVTPTLLPDDRVLLNIAVQQDKVSDLVVQGVPAIKTQHLLTQAIVTNNHTVVLGGLYETRHTKQVDGIPLLQDLPVLGLLFRNETKRTERRELLIFVTPHVSTN